MSPKYPNKTPADYEVGYGKPPKPSQFKSGQSGNPKGRKKAQPTFRQEVEKELNRKVSIIENGVSRRVTRRNIIAKQLVKSAAAGDLKAIDRTNAILSERNQEESGNGKPDISAVVSTQVLKEFLKHNSIGVDEQASDEVDLSPTESGTSQSGSDEQSQKPLSHIKKTTTGKGEINE